MHNQKIRYLLMIMTGGLLGLLSLAHIGHAQTVITDGYLYNDTIWIQANSPYIIEDPVFVPKGVTLKIDPGVSIIGSSLIDGYSLINVEGSLIIKGSVDNHVSITGTGSIDISNSSLGDIENCDISISSGLNVYDSRLNLRKSIISGMKVGITARSSLINILDSKISDNDYGIIVQEPDGGGIFPVLNNKQSAMGGMGNIFALETEENISDISIVNSSIVDNSVVAIENKDISFVQAKNNWWGNKNGPSMFGTNKIVGSISYAPWLLDDPLLVNNENCCSSILFIPGLQATRLYRSSDSFFGQTTNKLWEPNRNADVEKLFLDNNGSSTDSSIYVGEIISKAYGLKDIYGEFKKYLDNLKDSKSINEWKAFGYDWRMPITEVVAGNLSNSSSTKVLVEVVSQMALRSKTGKVTIVAHSNGGLVSKYLIKTLFDIGKSDLIDQVISVAVPYLGTPQAILGLLHGYDQSIAGGLILKESTARALGQNMASAYSLLPSRSYFEGIFGPTIAFASTSVGGVNGGKYPVNILSYQDQADFIVDSKNARVEPKSTDTNFPLEGNKKLILAADILHGILDPFSWPSTISKWAIAGWGENTTKKIVYSDEVKCKNGKCKTVPVFDIEQTKLGDGTVVIPSAVYNSSNVVLLDLEAVSEEENRDIVHSNILGASSTISTIDKIITKKSKNDQVVIDEISKIPNAKIGVPDFNKEPVSLVISTHSPVDLHVYDDHGRHVGIGAIPAGLDEDIEEGLITFIDEEIPGVSFDQRPDGFGGNSNYIYLPDDDGEKYTIVINGNGFGDFTYKVERRSGGTVLDKIVYKDIPVTPLTIATTTIQARISETASIPILSSSSPRMDVDMDGNGSVDIAVTPTTHIDPIKYYQSLKSIIEIMLGQSKRGKDIIKRINKLEERFMKGNIKKIRDFSEKLEERLKHKKFKNMTSTDREKIVDLIEVYVSQFE